MIMMMTIILKTRSSSKRSNSTAVSNKVTPMRRLLTRRANNVSMEVCVIKPASVDDSREICRDTA